jgi:hypothetical protein
MQHLTAVTGHADLRSEHGLGRGRTEQDRHIRLHDHKLPLPPLRARAHLARVWLLVQARLARHRFPFEVLHRVGEVHIVPSDPGGVERVVEDAAGGAHERATSEVLLVAGLLADQ